MNNEYLNPIRNVAGSIKPKLRGCVCPTTAPLIFSYLALRKTIGILGIALPFVLFLGAYLIFQTGIQSSLSSYYHTEMRDVFVGTLFVIGFFLFAYNGYDLADKVAGYIACIAAVGLALFPTAPDGATSTDTIIIGYIHLGFAAIFFLALIYFSFAIVAFGVSWFVKGEAILKDEV